MAAARSQPHVVHADLAAASALAAAHEQRAAALIEIGLGERERLVDAQPGPPQHHDQAAQPAAVRVVAGRAHDRDDLLDLRRIGRVAQTLVARRATGVEAGHGRRRSASAGAIEQQLGHDPSSGSGNEPRIWASPPKRQPDGTDQTKRRLPPLVHCDTAVQAYPRSRFVFKARAPRAGGPGLHRIPLRERPKLGPIETPRALALSIEAERPLSPGAAGTGVGGWRQRHP